MIQLHVVVVSHLKGVSVLGSGGAFVSPCVSTLSHSFTLSGYVCLCLSLCPIFCALCLGTRISYPYSGLVHFTFTQQNKLCQPFSFINFKTLLSVCTLCLICLVAPQPAVLRMHAWHMLCSNTCICVIIFVY